MDDTISRQGAIKIFDERREELTGIYGDLGGAMSGVVKIIKKMPSAETETIKWETCYDCPLSHGCPVINGCTNEQAMEYAGEIPDNCPLNTKPKRKKGKWIPQDFNKTNGWTSTAVYYLPKCSICGEAGNTTNYCPNCGADMRGE